MTRFVIDAPTLVRIAREDHTINPEHQLVAPNTIRSHALDLLLDAVQREEMTETEALETHERITELKMRLLGDRVSRRVAWNLARQRGWNSVRQAEYLAVAQLQADALVAADADLLEKADGLVQLATLDELVR